MNECIAGQHGCFTIVVTTEHTEHKTQSHVILEVTTTTVVTSRQQRASMKQLVNTCEHGNYATGMEIAVTIVTTFNIVTVLPLFISLCTTITKLENRITFTFIFFPRGTLTCGPVFRKHFTADVSPKIEELN